MSRLMRMFVAGALCLSMASVTWAAETKEEKMTSDESQAQYQRKSITYLGIAASVGIPEPHLRIVESGIRKLTELPRFDYNAVELSSDFTIDQFVAELREYVKKASVDRAAAESEYEARFKRAKILASDIDRIMKSAYFYTISVSHFSNVEAKCPSGKLEAALLGCLPDAPGMLATLNANTTFYRANLVDESKAPYELIKKVTHIPTRGFKQFAVLPTPDTLVQLRESTGQQATRVATSGLAQFLSKGMKQIPVFQLKTPVQAALADGVEFMLGKAQGLGLDDTYDVTEFDAAGGKKLVGYVKVRKVSKDAKGTGDGSPSYAENVKVKQKFVGGEQLYEHPMIGVSLGVHAVMQMTFVDLLTNEDTGIYPGVGLYLDKNLANLIGISEFYFSVEGDILLLGEDGIGRNWMLVHAMAGVKKKWYMESLVFSAGVRGGVSYFQVDDYEDDTLGFGGDALLGVEYYIQPEFSVYLKGGFRFFTNPIFYGSGVDAEPEMGVNVSLGVFYAL